VAVDSKTVKKLLGCLQAEATWQICKTSEWFCC